MRILIITGSFPPMKCGVGDYTACLATALGKLKNMRVAVLTSEKVCPPENAAPYELFPVIKRWKIIEFIRIIKIIRQWHPDIVHIQYPTQGYVGGGRLPFLLPLLLFILNIKVVQTWHEFYTRENAHWLYTLKAVIPGALIVVRPNYRENILPLYRWLIKHKQVHFIPNASVLPRITINNEERLSIHRQYAPSTKALVVYFGFIYEHKGTDLLFDIADPSKHHLVVIGAFDEADPYHKMLKERSQQEPWSGKVTITGFLPVEESARILAAADAVVLPFRTGGGLWNTSLHGAAIQGTFVLTTSRARHGYDPLENIFYAHPGDIDEMRQALLRYAGQRNTEENINKYPSWESIAVEHQRLYGRILH